MGKKSAGKEMISVGTRSSMSINHNVSKQTTTLKNPLASKASSIQGINSDFNSQQLADSAAASGQTTATYNFLRLHEEVAVVYYTSCYRKVDQKRQGCINLGICTVVCF